MSTIDGTLDDVDWAILKELQADARISWRELGRRVALSPPAVADRVRRLEEAGVVTGYRAELDLSRVGRSIVALVRVTAELGAGDAVGRLARECPEVLDCVHVTGDDCYVVKVAVGSVGELEAVIGQFARHGRTTTSLVLSAPVTGRVLGPPAADAAAAAAKPARGRRSA